MLARAERRINSLSPQVAVHKRVLFLLLDPGDLFVGGNEHSFSSVVDKINSDTQFGGKKHPLQFHFIGHSDPHHGFGSMLLDKRMQPKLLALLIAQFLERIPGKYVNLIFETCNNAYFTYTDKMSVDEIEKALINESLIGKFAQKLQEEGVDMRFIRVVGFRGFVEIYGGELWSVNIATDLPHDATLVKKSSSAHSKFIITANKSGELIAIIPEHPIYHSIQFPGATAATTAIPATTVDYPASLSRDAFFSADTTGATENPNPLTIRNSQESQDNQEGQDVSRGP